MTMEDFLSSLSNDFPPEGISTTLQALWYDAKGEWEKAHRLAQSVDSADGAWVHAYLHRKEGDVGNASYWYHRAGKPRSRLSLEEEWEEIVKALL